MKEWMDMFMMEIIGKEIKIKIGFRLKTKKKRKL